MNYRIKNWEKFQHFKDRRPPWIKLYRDILDDLEWFKLDSDSKAFLVELWLLASEDKDYTGNIPAIEVISFRLRKPVEVINNLVSSISHWLERTDIETISKRYQDGSPETETETERETETEKDITLISNRERGFKKPSISEIGDYCKERNNPIDPESFFDFYESKNWMIGKNKMKDWKAAVRTWEKNNFNKEKKEDKSWIDLQSEAIELKLAKKVQQTS